MLNAGAIGLATQTWSHLNGAEAAPSENTYHTALILVPAPSEPALPTVTRDAALPVTAPAAAHRPPPSLPMARTTLPAKPPGESTQQVLFYTFHEVDSPAFPESDWNLDVESLDSVGVQRLVFEVLVSDRGQIVGCTVLAPTNLAGDVKRNLETRLSETPLLPALRAGQLVASVRRIELVVAPALPDLQALAPAHRP